MILQEGTQRTSKQQVGLYLDGTSDGKFATQTIYSNHIGGKALDVLMTQEDGKAYQANSAEEFNMAVVGRGVVEAVYNELGVTGAFDYGHKNEGGHLGLPGAQRYWTPERKAETREVLIQDLASRYGMGAEVFRAMQFPGVDVKWK